MCVGGYVNPTYPRPTRSSYFWGKPGKRQMCKYSYMELLPKNYQEIRLVPSMSAVIPAIRATFGLSLRLALGTSPGKKDPSLSLPAWYARRK